MWKRLWTVLPPLPQDPETDRLDRKSEARCPVNRAGDAADRISTEEKTDEGSINRWYLAGQRIFSKNSQNQMAPPVPEKGSEAWQGDDNSPAYFDGGFDGGSYLWGRNSNSQSPAVF